MVEPHHHPGLVEEAPPQVAAVAVRQQGLDDAQLLHPPLLARRREEQLAHPAPRHLAEQDVLAEHPGELAGSPGDRCRLVVHA